MKKLLTVLLSLTMAISLTAAAVSVFASTGSTPQYTQPDTMDVYGRYASGEINVNNTLTGEDKRGSVDLFSGVYASSWQKGASWEKLENGVATIKSTGTAGHPLKTAEFGYGTFVMTYDTLINPEFTAQQKEMYYNTAKPESSVGAFFGWQFMNTFNPGDSWNTLSSPWTCPGGYPYNICIDSEGGTSTDDPLTDPNVVGVDGQATMYDENGELRLVYDVVKEDLEDGTLDGEYGRKYQTGLSLRRYKASGSHNYYRWCPTNPMNATQINSIKQEMTSIIPDYYRPAGVRVEECVDEDEHTLLVQFKPLYVDNGDGIDAMMIDVWMSGLEYKEGDETKEVGGKTFTHCMLVYDKMPYADIDNEGVVIDKRADDGHIVMWVHDNVKASNGWNTTWTVSEFKLLETGLHTTYDGSLFQQLSGPTFLGGVATYDGTPKSFTMTKPDDVDVLFTDDAGNQTETMPTYTDAGTYTVTARFMKPGYKALTCSATLTINKGATYVDAKTSQTFAYDGQPKTIAASVKTGDRTQDIPELNEYLTFSPANGTLTNPGIYYVYVSLPETKNHNKPSSGKWVKVTITGNAGGDTPGGGDSEELQFSEQELEAITWVGCNLDEDFTATYDGKEHCLYLINLPEGASVTYTNNVQKNAGEYTVSAMISKEGYTDLSIDVTMTIAKAEVQIIAEDVQEFFYCNADIAPVAYASNGAAVTIGKTVKNIGTEVITVSVAETTNYKGASKDITVTVKMDVKED